MGIVQDAVGGYVRAVQLPDGKLGFQNLRNVTMQLRPPALEHALVCLFLYKRMLERVNSSLIGHGAKNQLGFHQSIQCRFQI